MAVKISGMMGTGSMGHNNRKFITENVDPARTEQNITLCRENLKQVYQGRYLERDQAAEGIGGTGRRGRADGKAAGQYHRASEGADHFAGAAAPAIHTEAAEGGAGAV